MLSKVPLCHQQGDYHHHQQVGHLLQSKLLDYKNILELCCRKKLGKGDIQEQKMLTFQPE